MLLIVELRYNKKKKEKTMGLNFVSEGARRQNVQKGFELYKGSNYEPIINKHLSDYIRSHKLDDNDAQRALMLVPYIRDTEHDKWHGLYRRIVNDLGDTGSGREGLKWSAFKQIIAKLILKLSNDQEVINSGYLLFTYITLSPENMTDANIKGGINDYFNSKLMDDIDEPIDALNALSDHAYVEAFVNAMINHMTDGSLNYLPKDALNEYLTFIDSRMDRILNDNYDNIIQELRERFESLDRMSKDIKKQPWKDANGNIVAPADAKNPFDYVKREPQGITREQAFEEMERSLGLSKEAKPWYKRLFGL